MSTGAGYIRKSGEALDFVQSFKQSDGKTAETGGTATLALYRLNTDGTLSQYDFSDNTWGGTITTGTASLTHRAAGIWTFMLSTLTGLSVSEQLIEVYTHSTAGQVERRSQYGSVDGDGPTAADVAAVPAAVVAAIDAPEVEQLDVAAELTSYGVATASQVAEAEAAAQEAATAAGQARTAAELAAKPGDAMTLTPAYDAAKTAAAAGEGLTLEQAETMARIQQAVPDGPITTIEAPANAESTTAYVQCFDTAGQAVAGVVIEIAAVEVAESATGNAFDGSLKTATSDAEGMAQTQIPRRPELTFKARRQGGQWVTFAGVDAPTLALPSILGITPAQA
jgi:hypothetical protein